MTTPLIDATEMYLKTIWELEEEDITPIRARLVERLRLSAPAVSETVSRLEQDGLVHITGDRRLELTDHGRELAEAVMRKHRLVERLLTDILHLDLEHVHIEACRWEHVISDRVENQLAELLHNPATDPYGNPIPGQSGAVPRSELVTLLEAAKNASSATVKRYSEKLQNDAEFMSRVREAGVPPDTVVDATVETGHVAARTGDTVFRLTSEEADLVYVQV